MNIWKITYMQQNQKISVDFSSLILRSMKDTVDVLITTGSYLLGFGILIQSAGTKCSGNFYSLYAKMKTVTVFQLFRFRTVFIELIHFQSQFFILSQCTNYLYTFMYVKSHVYTIISHVDIIMLHVDIDKLQVNIIQFHVDSNYLAFTGQNSAMVFHIPSILIMHTLYTSSSFLVRTLNIWYMYIFLTYIYDISSTQQGAPW